MNDESIVNDPSPASTDMVGSPGIAVREARKGLGMSIEELATQTRLSKATLEALEGDQFEKLLEPVYVRGYYRKCAGILEIDEKPLIAAYDSLYTPPPKPQPTKLRLASGGDLGSAPRVPGRLAIIGPVIAIIIGVAFWMSRQPASLVDGPQTVTLLEPGLQGSIQPGDTMPPLDGEVVAAQPIAPSPAIDSTADRQTEPAPDGRVALAPAESETTSASDSVVSSDHLATDPVQAQPAVSSTVLTLSFEAISWTRIEDATGALMLSGIIPAGETRELDGRPPYSVFLGNGPGVRIEYQGETVDVKPFVKNNSTARFSVPIAGG